MKLLLLPPGGPSEHLGLSHTLKHYLRPQEMWEDICDDVEPAQRPRAVADELPMLSPPVWDQWKTPPAALADAWDRLHPAYEHGYGALILSLAEALPEPSRYVACGTCGTPSDPWVARGSRRVCDAGAGVVLMVNWGRGGWLLYSALRPMDFKLGRHECPPTDQRSVSIRRKLAELATQRRMAVWRAEEQKR